MSKMELENKQAFMLFRWKTEDLGQRVRARPGLCVMVRQQLYIVSISGTVPSLPAGFYLIAMWHTLR
jgi:hypothetical protein